MEDPGAARQRYEQYEKLIITLQQPCSGVEIQDRKLLLKTVYSCFTSENCITCLIKCCPSLKDRANALIFCQNLLKDGYLFPIDEYTPIVDSVDQYLRFQTPYFWPTVNGNPSDFDYSVYLVKTSIRKGAHNMKSNELENLSYLQTKLRRRWGFVLQHAADEIDAAKDRSNSQAQVLDSQERAYWWIHRLARKQGGNGNGAITESIKETVFIDPRARKAREWSKGLATLLKDEEGYKMFRTHIEREHNGENLDFWEACGKFLEITEPNDLKSEAKSIWDTYLVPYAPREINIPASIRERINRNMQEGDINIDMFNDARKSILTLMSKDIYIRFLRCPEYRELLHQAKELELLDN